MARHNEIFLYGMVLMPPVFKKNEEGKNVRGCVSLLVIRGQRDICNNKLTNIRYDAPMIITENEDMLILMEQMKINNMVEVKGVFTTKDILKAKICPCCKHKNAKKGTVSYISPIYMDIRETGIDETRAKALLEKRSEISNTVTVLGTVPSEPNFYHEGKLSTMQYALAVNRKYFVQEDSTLSKTDYPIIRSFGKIAEEDHTRIKVSTELLINGMLQTKEFMNKITCEECGELSEFKDTAMEIIPYSVEYLKNYVTNEELEASHTDANKQIVSQLFDEK